MRKAAMIGVNSGQTYRTTGVIVRSMFIQGNLRNLGDPFCSLQDDGFFWVCHQANNTRHQMYLHSHLECDKKRAQSKGIEGEGQPEPTRRQAEVIVSS